MTTLATVILYAFNEEDYIRESVQSLFSQTYSPLEIILSDDGSIDCTFDIMQQMAAEYSGPHKVILNRNARNIGIGSQLNESVAKSSGELIVLANGDDISLPNRVSALVQLWQASQGKASVITSDLAIINSDGNVLNGIINTETVFTNLTDGVRRRFGGVQAASLAVRRDVFENFGPLPDNLILEDNPLYLRATLIGERLHTHECLVQYRIHANNISQAYEFANFLTWRQRHQSKLVWQRRESIKAYLQMLRDLYASPAENWPADDLQKARWMGLEKTMENSILADYYSSNHRIFFLGRLASLVRLALLLFKVFIKISIPALELRNDRWHFLKTKSRF
jgi:glycosyltransferase involved in cell wall biosynthesis